MIILKKKEIYVTSDQHFSQKSILGFKDKDGNLIRPGFSSVEEMDEFMISQWNSVVKQNDHVWWAGDLTYDLEKFKTKILHRLNGHLRLIPGNHDNIRELSKINRFEKIEFWRRMPEFGLIITHVPIDKDSSYNHRQQEYMKNIHGHTHQNCHPDVDHYKNICVEINNYVPYNIEELRVK